LGRQATARPEAQIGEDRGPKGRCGRRVLGEEPAISPPAKGSGKRCKLHLYQINHAYFLAYRTLRKGKNIIDTKKRNSSEQESKGLAVITYVEGLSETAERIFRKYGINTAMKPYRTLRQLLVYPKINAQ